MSKLNLLMLNYEFPPIGGGAGQAQLSLLKEYANSDDIKIDVLTSAPKPGFFIEKFSENITIHKVGLHKKSIQHWRKIEVIEWLIKAKPHYRHLLRNDNYDLVHAFFGFPTGWLCYRTANKIPYIISLRGSDVPGKHARLQLDYKILAPVFRAIWKKADALVACSEGLKNRALNFLPSVPIDVITNGVDLEKFSPVKTAKIETLKLLAVGRLSVTKRVDMLINAVEILKNDGHKIHLTLAGSGGLETELKQLVTQKNLNETIEFLGVVEAEKMPDLYRQNNILVSATSQEGMSNAMLEAMASGLPIVTTGCEGTEELIADNGIVVEQADANSIAAAIKALADDEDSYIAMCEAARKRAENFSWENVALQYLSCYERIIQKK